MKVKIIVRSNLPRKKKKKYKKRLEKISIAEFIYMRGDTETLEVLINSEGGNMNIFE